MHFAKKCMFAATAVFLMSAAGGVAIAHRDTDAANTASTTTEVITKYDSNRWRPDWRRHERRHERRFIRRICMDECLLRHGRHHCESKCFY